MLDVTLEFFESLDLAIIDIKADDGCSRPCELNGKWKPNISLADDRDLHQIGKGNLIRIERHFMANLSTIGRKEQENIKIGNGFKRYFSDPFAGVPPMARVECGVVQANNPDANRLVKSSFKKEARAASMRSDCGNVKGSQCYSIS